MEPSTAKTTTIEAAAPSVAAGKSKKPKKGEKTAAKTKTAKEPKSKKKPTEPLVVFAFRLSAANRDFIHTAAGPGKASQFVLQAALAAAKEALAR